ncbi:MAG: hypothetical protein KAV83_04905 [Desulfobacterales bacterium]|nr:hypothetical protein [Desulfobacterales bacterium]
MPSLSMDEPVRALFYLSPQYGRSLAQTLAQSAPGRAAGRNRTRAGLLTPIRSFPGPDRVCLPKRLLGSCRTRAGFPTGQAGAGRAQVGVASAFGGLEDHYA